MLRDTTLYEQMSGSGEPGLRILFYVDDLEFETGRYRLMRLGAALKRKSIHVETRSRVSGATINRQLLSGFDEVWFFLRAREGKELDVDEIEALHGWMDEGHGVLVTGDHHEFFNGEWIGLGAPVGRSIPRAGNLRAWGRGPGTDRVDSLDSIEIAREPGDVIEAQQDTTPQRLILPVCSGDRRHPVFQGRDGRLLDRFPDHMHEGELRIAPADWAGQPSPAVIARGIDHWRAQCFDLMAAWDGHRANGGAKGRILADSSWHHYVDHNLDAIAERGGENWEKIQELYYNQAVWLAPPNAKLARCDFAMKEVAAFLQREATVAPQVLGERALKLLARRLPGAAFAELVPMLSNDKVASEGHTGLPGISAHLVGAYVRRLQQAQGLKVERGGDRERAMMAAPEALRGSVFEDAVSSYRAELGALLVRFEGLAREVGLSG